MRFLLVFNTVLAAVTVASHASDGPPDLSNSRRIQLIREANSLLNVTQYLGTINSEAETKFSYNSTLEHLGRESDGAFNSTQTSQQSASEEESVEYLVAENELKDSKLYISRGESDAISELSGSQKTSEQNNLRSTSLKFESSNDNTLTNRSRISDSIHRPTENNNDDFKSTGAVKNSKPKRKRKNSKSSRKWPRRNSSDGKIMARPEVAPLLEDPGLELEVDYVDIVTKPDYNYGVTEILPDIKYKVVHYNVGDPYRGARLLVYDKRAWVFPQQNITLNFTYPTQERRQTTDFRGFLITEFSLSVTHQMSRSRLFLRGGGLRQTSLQLSVVVDEISLICYTLSVFGKPAARQVGGLAP